MTLRKLMKFLANTVPLIAARLDDARFRATNPPPFAGDALIRLIGGKGARLESLGYTRFRTRLDYRGVQVEILAARRNPDSARAATERDHRKPTTPNKHV